ncbi:hypothetical protein E1B28_001810 [Marasmius oreades]|uniref:Uncharacterized protein n=1 Tax=Marasmius oreades TaxID=181124 RepID=A0A9P7V4C7_9AGAR|nr:uncharacterized protein E1B28_001810 [Marasmius oreades]KAG7100024.1 hypothetical protein E1B28_001810 [Marasmius oreades]
MAKPPNSTPLLGLQSTEKQGYSFLYSGNSDLPKGTFVVTGLSKLSDFASFLDDSSECQESQSVRHVLLSDVSFEDLEDNFGFLKLPKKILEHTVTENNDTSTLPTTGTLESACFPGKPGDIDTTDEEEDILSYNRKLRRRLARAVRDLPNVVERIFGRIAPTVETLSLLLYISPSFESEIHGYHSDWPMSQRNGYMEAVDSFFWKKDTLGERVQKYQFPNLNALTLRNALRLGDARVSVTSRSSDYEVPFPLLENLTHLHIAQAQTFAGSKRAPSVASLRESLPRLTHVRFTGSPQPRLFKDPPREVHEGWSKQMNDLLPIGWWDNILRALNAYPDPPKLESLVPPNLKLIIHPNYSHRFTSTGGFCGTYLVEYDDFVEGLREIEKEQDNIHLVWPSEEGWNWFSNLKDASTWELDLLALFPVSRALEDFRERIRGGEGEWRIVTPNSENRRRWW